MAMKRLKGLFDLSSTVATTYGAATIFIPKSSAAGVNHPTPAVTARSFSTNTQSWDKIFMECSTHSQEGGLDSTSKGGGEVEMWVDMPGMEKEWIEVATNYKRDILFLAKAPKEWENEEIGRSYTGRFDLRCRCCHIKDFKHSVDNGVLRIVVSKVKIK